MHISLRLRKLLAEHNLDKHGIIQEMASDIHVERHRLNNLFRPRPATISLDLLGEVCSWLVAHQVPPESLPGGLFSTGRTDLWEAIARTRHVTLYLGEYQSTTQPAVANRWIASSDALVEARLIQKLSMGAGQGSGGPSIKPVHVPFSYVHKDANVDQGVPAQDIRHTGRIYAQLKASAEPGTTILIGSQRANYLLEHFVADLFGCKPFTPPQGTGKVRVPFFSVYRDRDRYTPSAFGGKENPFRRRDRNVSGLHYLSKGKWITCPWVEGRQDAGVVITRWDHPPNAITLALVGFSGRATEALGEQLVLKEKCFWPPATQMKGTDLGIYLCKLTYPAGRRTNTECKIVALSDGTVSQRLS